MTLADTTPLALDLDLDAVDPSSPAWQAVLDTVVGIIGGIVGEVYLEGLGVGPETRFESDLDLESMEIVQLAEELMARYDGRVDFVAWFATMELDDIIDLSLGQVVSFIVASLRRSAFDAAQAGS